MNKTKKIIYVILGSISLGLAFVGAVLPFLPYTPFVFLTLFFYGKSSEKLDRWFKTTKLYRNNVEEYVKTKKLTKKVKIKIMVTVTILIAIGCVTMYFSGVPIYAFGILFLVWLFHMLLFTFKIKTLTPGEKQRIMGE